MKVRVKLFAAAKEFAGTDALDMDVPANATIADLQKAIADEYPALQKIIPHSAWAIGAEYVPNNTAITTASDIAMIPPVSGG